MKKDKLIQDKLIEDKINNNETDNQIKAILFDLDNTLIDFMMLKQNSIESAVDAMISAGLKINKKTAIKELFLIYREIGLENQEIFQIFLKKFNGKIDYKILACAITAYRFSRQKNMKSYPGVKNTLNYIRKKGIKTAIVSDAPRIKAWIRLVNMKLENCFDVVITYDDTHQRKPSKLPFKKAIDNLKIKPENCLMVGDWPERDIFGAKQLGMKTAFAKYGYDRKDKPKYDADFVLEKIDDLKKII